MLKVICRWCGKDGHLVTDCPDRKPKLVTEVVANKPKPVDTSVDKPELVTERVDKIVDKKKWIKPKLTVWKPVRSRKEYQREWVRKKRGRLPE